MTAGRLGLIILAALLAGGLGYRWWAAESQVPPGNAAPLLKEITKLQAQLERLDAEQRLSAARIADLEQNLIEVGMAAAVNQVDAEPALAIAEQPAETADTSDLAPASPRRGSGDPQRILEAGLTPEEYESFDNLAQQLYLENFEQQWLQRRDSYLSADRVQTSRERLRQDLGDDAYDRYLYASGSSNRVRVRRVMSGSAADSAGLTAGDIVLSYDGQRVFNFDDLRGASYQGELGDSVILDVRRADGTVSQVVMSRGPMGVSGYGGWREVPDS